jgi:signal transduction histidine kinase
LTIVKYVAELHRGEVLVESEEGKGSRFTLRLPAL